MATSTSSERIVAVDVTRALAIIGMIAVHSLYAYDAQGNPSLSYTISAGKSSAAFAVLAGVSISFIIGRKRLAGPTVAGKIASLLTRAGLIGVIGLLLGYTNGELAVVILPYYALMFALAIPLAGLSTRTLIKMTIGLFLITPVISQLLRPHLISGLERQLDFGYLVTEPVAFVSDIFLTGQFPALVWMSYICVGLLIGRLPLRSPQTMTMLLGIGAALVVVAWVGSWYILQIVGAAARLQGALPTGQANEILTFGADGSVPTSSWWWLAVNAPHTGTTFDLMTTTGYTLLVLGATLTLEYLLRGRAKHVFDVIIFPLASAGTMALTLYVGHIVFINSPLDKMSPTPTFWWQILALAIFASIWSILFDRGPLEGLVTRCTKFAQRRINRRFNRVSEASMHR